MSTVMSMRETSFARKQSRFLDSLFGWITRGPWRYRRFERPLVPGAAVAPVASVALVSDVKQAAAVETAPDVDRAADVSPPGDVSRPADVERIADVYPAADTLSRIRIKDGEAFVMHGDRVVQKLAARPPSINWQKEHDRAVREATAKLVREQSAGQVSAQLKWDKAQRDLERELRRNQLLRPILR